MLKEFLKKMGYSSIDDAVELLITGLAVLPALLMLCGFVVEGAMAMVLMLTAVMTVAMHAPPPKPPQKNNSDTPERKPPA